MAIARNVAAIWKLRTANIGAQAGTDILRLRNIAQFGRKKRAAIADIKRATNQFINKKNLSYGIEIKSKRSNRPFRGEREKGFEKRHCRPSF